MSDVVDLKAVHRALIDGSFELADTAIIQLDEEGLGFEDISRAVSKGLMTSIIAVVGAEVCMKHGDEGLHEITKKVLEALLEVGIPEAVQQMANHTGEERPAAIVNRLELDFIGEEDLDDIVEISEAGGAAALH